MSIQRKITASILTKCYYIYQNYLCLAVAQLVERGIVVVNNIPGVPGSNPGGEIFAHQQHQKNNFLMV